MRRRPVVAIATKADAVDRERLAEHLIAIDQLGDVGRDHPVLGRLGGARSRRCATSCRPSCRESPQLYPDGVLTDEPEMVMIAELVREAALEGVRDELPHSLAVVVEEMVPREGRPDDKPLLDVRVNVFVERPSQKAIVIGTRRLPAARGRHQRPQGRSRRCSARRSTSTCTSRSPRTGSATPSSSSASASDGALHRRQGARAWQVSPPR